MAGTKASVIVCTFNRAASLARTLDALGQQRVRAGTEWELVVVDNNSSDDTRQVVEAHQAGQPNLRYERESQQGLSHARNRGLSVASGEVILFTDDDVRPYPDWLQGLLDAFDRYGCDACGGYVEPDWERPPPAWLTSRFHGFLAVRMDEEGPRRIARPEDCPYGASMAFRRDVFTRYGVFDTGRGRKGKKLASGEDGELFGRVLKDGGSVYYVPQARVRHHVEAFRLNKAYFRRWRFETSSNIAETVGIPTGRVLGGIPLYLFPQLLRAGARAAWGKVSLPADEAFYRELIVWHFLGLMHGLRARRRPGVADGVGIGGDLGDGS